MEPMKEMLDLPCPTSIDYDEIRHRQVESMNAQPGTLQGYDCSVCLNKGVVYYDNGETVCCRKCGCLETRKAARNIERSGLKELLGRYTMESYEAREQWQKKAKEKAELFLNSPHENWFFAGGQVGSGKTHLCTAIVGELLQKGVPCRYMLWRDEAQRLRAALNDSEFEPMMERLCNVKCLYIDDFLKVQNGEYYGKSKPVPTPGDIGIAFQIINARYNRKGLITVISSEHFLDDINAFDSGIGSRIFERCRGFRVEIERDDSRNWRTRV